MFYGSFGTYNSIVTIIFIFDQRSCQVQVKKVKFRNWKKYFLNILILSSFVSWFQKCHLVWRPTIGNANNEIKNVTPSPLPDFWVIAQREIKILAGNFVQWKLVYSFMLRKPFFGYLPKFWFVGIYFWKIEILIIGGLKKQKWKSVITIL